MEENLFPSELLQLNDAEKLGVMNFWCIFRPLCFCYVVPIICTCIGQSHNHAVVSCFIFISDNLMAAEDAQTLSYIEYI